MAKLATVADFNHYLDSEFGEADPRINRLLELASGKVQRYCRQSFVEVTDDLVQLSVNPGERTIFLPERPVTDVSAVSLIGVGVTNLPVASYEWSAKGELYWLGGGYWPHTVEATYTHGYAAGEIPDDVVEVVCGVVARIMDNPTQDVQEAVDAHAVSHGEGWRLTAEDRMALRDYRVTTFTTWVAPSVRYRQSALGVIGNA